MSQISKEAVAGVWPVEYGEADIAHRFPSIAATAAGRFFGRLYALPFPIGFVIHLLTLPFPILLAVGMYVSSGFKRYQLTSLRVRIRRGFGERAAAELQLDAVDDVRLVVRPGQEFYRAGDIELVKDGKVALVLPGVTTAEAFHHNITEARTALLSVRECLRLQQQESGAAPALAAAAS